MVDLTRTVRVVINPDSSGAQGSGTNGFAGTPAMQGLGRYYELVVRCSGDPEPASGYLVNIKEVDQAVRSGVSPILEQLCKNAPTTDPATVIHRIRTAADAKLHIPITSVFWKLTPTYGVEADMKTDSVLIRQQFDFAASHRLHVPDLSDEENRRIFGKCNNPSGHGHNYRVEIAVRVPADGTGPTLTQIEPIVDQTLIERFDHTYLNEDTDEFGPAGVNPSVEHIAIASFKLLDQPLLDLGGKLDWITVWETDRTSCTFHRPQDPADHAAPVTL